MSDTVFSENERSHARRKRTSPRRLGALEAMELPPRVTDEMALLPITAIPEQALGPAGGAWVSEQRARNRTRLSLRTAEALKERGVALDFETSPSVAMPLIGVAQDEGREELVGLWARLLATALDPARRHHYRRDFVAIAAALEPMDLLCLEKLDSGMTKAWRYRRESVAKALGQSQDRANLALGNLAKLGLIDPAKLDSTDFQPFVTPLGREFLMALGHGA
ncbi:MAG TPA: hypothetical protein VGI89_12090 [Rhizomicrobium sp.]|jgi:hypothetical protein